MKIKKEWLGNRKQWLIVLVIWIAVFLMMKYEENLYNFSIEILYSFRGYETHYLSSDPIAKDLLPRYFAKKESYGFLVKKVGHGDIVNGTIHLCNKGSSREDIKCHGNLPRYDSFSCHLFKHPDTPNGFMIGCFKEDYAVSITSMADLKQACVEMWDQANYFSEKYLDREFPSCELLDKVQEAQQQSKLSLVFGDLPA